MCIEFKRDKWNECRTRVRKLLALYLVGFMPLIIEDLYSNAFFNFFVFNKMLMHHQKKNSPHCKLDFVALNLLKLLNVNYDRPSAMDFAFVLLNHNADMLSFCTLWQVMINDGLNQDDWD